MDSIIKIDKLVKKYNDFKLEATADIRSGFITGIIGSNGAGKTTLINSILNIIKYDSGSIYFDDQILTPDSIEYKEKIGVVFDSNFFPSFRTPLILESAIKNFYHDWSHDVFMNYLEMFEIEDDKLISSLSKGRQMKLMIAVALAHDPKVLILDEPTSGLDPISRDELLAILQEYVQENNKSVIFSTHITSDLDKIADYILYLENGKLIFQGPKSDLIENYRLVIGPRSELTNTQLRNTISAEISDYGFKALVEISKIKYFSDDKFKMSFPTIEDIMIFTNKNIKKGNKNEGK